MRELKKADRPVAHAVYPVSEFTAAKFKYWKTILVRTVFSLYLLHTYTPKRDNKKTKKYCLSELIVVYY